jgi:hypothetical protein
VIEKVNAAWCFMRFSDIICPSQDQKMRLLDVEKQIYDVNDSVLNFEKSVHTSNMAELSAAAKVHFSAVFLYSCLEELRQKKATLHCC